MERRRTEMLKSLLQEVVLSFLKDYWIWLLFMLLLGGTATWFGLSSRSYKERLRVALIEKKTLEVKVQSKDLELRKARNDVLIEREKKKDEASAVRLRELRTQSNKLEQERQELNKKFETEKKQLKHKSLEELDQILTVKRPPPPRPREVPCEQQCEPIPD